MVRRMKTPPPASYRSLRRSMKKTLVLSSVVLVSGLLASVPATAADTSLKDLMKKMGATAANGDAKALAPIFAETKGKAKPEFANWGTMADAGKASAEKGDLEG